MTKVSVIVPVYNQENYIRRCLDCLINQTYKEVEIICVNDNSTDNSLGIIDEYRKRDKRILIINNSENLTANISRKEGVIAAQGDYILFIDPDDTIELNTIEILVNVLQNKPVDILHFGTNVINNGVSQKQISWYENFSSPYYGEIEGEDVFISCFEKNTYRFNIWNKIYKTSLCKKAMEYCADERLPKAQDLYAFFLISYFARSYMGINEKLYNYNFGAGISGNNTTFTKEKFARHCSQADVAFFIIKFLIEQGTIEKYQKLVKKTINGLIEDNLARWRECGRIKTTWSAEEVIYEWWVNGKITEEFNKFFSRECGETVASIVLGIYFKIYKNVSIKTRRLVLEQFLNVNEHYPDALISMRDGCGINTKDRMFADTIVAALKSIKYGEKYVPIVMATNNNYAPFCGVAISSLIMNGNSEYFYDIYVLHSALNAFYIKKMNNMSSSNYEVHCMNIKELLNTQALYSNHHYSIEMYYRFFIPEMFFFLPKVLYLDCDIIVLNDVAKLYNTNIGNNILGAARNLLHNEMYNYVSNTLQINPSQYFNSGVLLINCEEFIANSIKIKCLKFLKNNQKLECPDQDALNVFCKNVSFISPQWNYQWHHQINIDNCANERYRLIPSDLALYKFARNDVKIVHFTSNKKPWNYLYSEYAEKFWEIAEVSIFSIETRFKYRDLDEKNKQDQKIKKLESVVAQIDSKKEKKSRSSKLIKSKRPSVFHRFMRFLKKNGLKETIKRIWYGKKYRKIEEGK